MIKLIGITLCIRRGIAMKRFLAKTAVSVFLSLVLVLELPMATIHADTTVYTTATGSKYHFSRSCRGLNNAKNVYETSLTDAKSRGLTACSICSSGSSDNSDSSSSSNNSSSNDSASNMSLFQESSSI